MELTTQTDRVTAALCNNDRRPHMAWAGSTRSSRLPTDWTSRRARVLRRDRHRCQLAYPAHCIGQATEVDHIVRGDNHAFSNLHAVCPPCHSHKTNVVERPTRRRPTENHPGLLG